MNNWRYRQFWGGSGTKGMSGCMGMLLVIIVMIFVFVMCAGLKPTPQKPETRQSEGKQDAPR